MIKMTLTPEDLLLFALVQNMRFKRVYLHFLLFLTDCYVLKLLQGGAEE